MKKWIVFSDLHVADKTVDVCIDVLRAVHDAARQHNARVAFLGDFWERRGQLPVTSLNRVVAEIASWTVESVWIPGNHDQVDLGGHVHGLDVIGASNRKATVISEPTEKFGALWIPYRRTKDEVIKAAAARSEDAKIILCHIDVVGAWMNDAIQSGWGIQPHELPSDIDILTGHYHRPHEVEGTRISYVGSPWEVSAHEAGQKKRLMLFDGRWRFLEDLPIEVGPKHWVGDVSKQGLDEAAEGDRIILRGQSGDIESLREKIREAEKRGVQVTVYHEAAERSAERIKDADRLPNERLVEAYCAIHYLNPEPMLEVLREQDVDAAPVEGAAVSIEKVSLKNFGPFAGEHDIDWGSRGIVFLQGSNADGSSNGAGKTTLAWAPVWAFTGETDPRPIGSSRRGLTKEVVTDRMTECVVSVEGQVNQKKFVVTRSVTKGKMALSVEVDGVDETQQDTKMTQAKVDRLLRLDLLIPAGWQSQHAEQSLLELTDKGAKQQLGSLVDVSIWEKCAAAASAARKKFSTDKVRAEGRLQTVEAQLARLGGSDAKDQLAMWEADRQKRVDDLLALVTAARVDLERLPAPVDVDELEAEVAKLRSEPESLRAAQKARRDAEVALGSAAASVQRAISDGKAARESLAKIQQSAEAGVCDACGSQVGQDHLQSRINAAEAALEATKEVYRAAKADQSQAQESLDLADKTLDSEEQSDAQRKDNYKKLMDELRVVAGAQLKIGAMKEQVRQLEARYDRAKQEVNPYTTVIEREQRERQRLQAEVIEAREGIEQAAKSEESIKACEAAFGAQGIPAYVIETTIGSLVERMSKYLHVLSNGKISVDLSATSVLKSGRTAEKISRTISVMQGGEVVERDIRQLSGGQRRRCAIASQLAFVELSAERAGVSIDSVVMDEVTQHLDAQGRAAVVEAAKAQGRRTVWLISHDEDLADLASSVVTIHHANGHSQVKA